MARTMKQDATTLSDSNSDALAFFERWGTEREMNALESTMWRGERHPTHSFTGTIIEIFDSTPDWTELVRWHQVALALVPRFRERVVEPILPVGPPVWAEDPNFDLAYHLRRYRLPAPGSIAQLLEVAQAQAITPMDRERPLWLGSFVDGLEGGRSAYILNVHHCLMDGMAAIQLLSRLQPHEPGGRLPKARTSRPPSRAPNPVELAGGELLGRIGSAPRTGVRLLGAAGGVVAAGPRQAARYMGSLSRVVKPPVAQPSPLMSEGTRTSWRFGVLECGLDELKAAGRAAGGTVNDAYVSAILGGLRRYHARMGVEIGDIPMSMPVSLRRPGDEAGGNRFAGAFFAAPSSIADPSERMRALGKTVRAIQTEPALDFFSLLLPALNAAPGPVVVMAFTRMQSLADLTVSNVPGPKTPMYMNRSRVDELFCFGPLPGSAMITVLCSYAGRCCIGVNCDAAAFTEAHALFELMQEGLDEVVDVGRS